MASGFSNSQDQLTPTYYRVYINLSGYSSTATSTASGAVEPFDYDSFATLNTTTNNSIRRARGNIRWNAILNQLQLFSNCEILDVTATTAGPAFETAADDVATALAFTVGYYQEEYIYNGWLKLTGGAVLSDGATPLDGRPWEQLSRSYQASNIAAAIQEAVTRGITLGSSSGYTRRYRTLDVFSSGGYEQRDLDVTITQPDTPANIWATITSCSVIESMTQETIDTASDT